MMFTRKPIDNGSGLVERATHVADESIHSAQVAATAVVDGLADGAQALHKQASSAVEQAAQRVETLARQGAQALRSSSQLLLDKAHAASSQTQHYIEREPVKAVLIAAATGAMLMALATLVVRSGKRY